MKEIIEFLRYVIDPCKLKSMILVFQCFILAMLIGCRAQHSFDKDRYEAEVEHQEGDDRTDDCLVYADSWNELKYNIKMYLEKFKRFGYDY